MSYDPSKIEALEGLEAVRHRPGLYLGDLMSPSLPARLMAQAMCHAVDEAVGGRKIRVSLEGTTSQRACVSYNAGMPLDIDRATRSYVALVFLVLHAGCSNRKKHIDVGSSFCELGLAVMNACCSHVSLEVSHKERSASFEFARGVLVSHKEPVPAPGPEFTRLSFELDPEVLLGNTTFDQAIVHNEIGRRARMIPNLEVALPNWQTAESSL
jgi:DNA gyrase/topoisomerase IV subunit B